MAASVTAIAHLGTAVPGKRALSSWISPASAWNPPCERRARSGPVDLHQAMCLVFDYLASQWEAEAAERLRKEGRRKEEVRGELAMWRRFMLHMSPARAALTAADGGGGMVAVRRRTLAAAPTDKIIIFPE